MSKIAIYTDGACKNNPGPGAWACVLLTVLSKMEKKQLVIRKISGYNGTKTTNNVMELTAIFHALKSIKYKEREIRVFTDSKYCIGMLTQGWNANKNKPLIETIRHQISEFPNITFEFTKGHNGDIWNEVCDELANQSIKSKSGIDEYNFQPAPEKELY